VPTPQPTNTGSPNAARNTAQKQAEQQATDSEEIVVTATRGTGGGGGHWVRDGGGFRMKWISNDPITRRFENLLDFSGTAHVVATGKIKLPSGEIAQGLKPENLGEVDSVLASALATLKNEVDREAARKAAEAWREYYSSLEPQPAAPAEAESEIIVTGMKIERETKSQAQAATSFNTNISSLIGPSLVETTLQGSDYKGPLLDPIINRDLYTLNGQEYSYRVRERTVITNPRPSVSYDVNALRIQQMDQARSGFFSTIAWSNSVRNGESPEITQRNLDVAGAADNLFLALGGTYAARTGPVSLYTGMTGQQFDPVRNVMPISSTRFPWGSSPDYTMIKAPRNLEASAKPTPRMVREMHRINREANGGLLRDDVTGEIGIPSSKSQRGVTPPPNEIQVDHIIPVDKGGTRTPENLNLRLRTNNRKKSNQ
jgi:hypothetical protein